MTPIGNKVFVEPIVVRQVNGIHLPEDITHASNTFADGRVGFVTHVGTGKRTKKGVHVPIGLKVGDKVCMPNHGRSLIRVGDKELWMLDADDVLCVLEPCSPNT